MTLHFQGLYSEFGTLKPGKGRLCVACFCVLGLSVTGNKESFCRLFGGGDGRPVLSRISAERNKHEINNQEWRLKQATFKRSTIFNHLNVSKSIWISKQKNRNAIVNLMYVVFVFLNQLKKKKKTPFPLLLWPFMWYWSSCWSWNAALHSSHGYGLSLAWVRRTWLSWAAWEAKAFPQCLHLNGRSPECWRMCVRRMLEAVKALGANEHSALTSFCFCMSVGGFYG